ncbi:MAG: trans-sulfuration enzyme family protein, partial [Gammaproteobacteria bacterium]
RAYYGVLQLAESLPARTGVEFELWKPGDMGALARLLERGAAGVWLETPANPTWDVVNIEAAARLAHRQGACVAVDSTCATPVLTRPLELGADYVMHSATKYLNGHSDVVAGALVARERDARFDRIRHHRAESGAIIGAFEAWLLLRGMRTLVPRVRAACANALAIAERLERHPALERVLYPGLASHPGHDVAVGQMSGGFGGMLSILLRGGRDAALAVAGNLELFVRATSLGGVESLVEHRASIEPAGTGVPANLLRLSVGIEDAEDLIDDLTQALDRATLAQGR